MMKHADRNLLLILNWKLILLNELFGNVMKMSAHSRY